MPVTLPIHYPSCNPRQRRAARLEYVLKQQNKCLYCKGALSEDPPKVVTERALNMCLFPQGFLQYPIHLHHCHKTGMSLGAVHAYCNGVLFQYHGE